MTPAWTMRFSADEDTADKLAIHDLAVAAWTPIMERYRMIVGGELWEAVWGGWQETWMRNVTGYVTEVGGEIVGYATYYESDKAPVEIGANAVRPDHQGRAIGSAQMRHLVAMFRDRGYRCAWVHTGMDPAHGPARAEYRKLGMTTNLSCGGVLGSLRECPDLPPPNGVTFRWANADDAQRVREMAVDAWRPVDDDIRAALGDDIYALTQADATAKRAEECGAATGEPRTVLLAEIGGRPVGFATVEEDKDRGLGKLDAVGVDPPHQGGGIGSALCMEAFRRFRERGTEYVVAWPRPGEVTPQTRRMFWKVGMYHEVLATNYYMML